MRIPVALAVLLAAAGCLGSSGPLSDGDTDVGRILEPVLADPLADGSYAYRFAEYEHGEVTVGGAGPDHKNYTYPAKLRGVVFAPEAAGPFPLVVFLHGQHTTCGFQDDEAFVSPPGAPIGPGACEGPEPWHPYPNHRGYDYLAKHLASHGYVVVSINGKEINDRNGAPDTGMWARGELVVATIDLLAQAGRGDVDLGVPLQGKVDTDNIGVMGHSRGGEGVVTATHVNALRATPYAIRAVLPLAPTDFNRRGVLDAAALVLVPYCDGDVYNLHGLRTFDHTIDLNDHAHIQLLVYGANHNNYNTNWGKGETAGVYRDGDDASTDGHLNAECGLLRSQGGGRLTSEQTQREGILHIAGFFRWVLGGEDRLAPYFQGDADMPMVACPERQACPAAVSVTSQLPGHRVLFNVTNQGINPVAADTVSLDGFASTGTCHFSACAPNMYSWSWTLDLNWTQPASVVTTFPASTFDGMDALAIRVGVPSLGDKNDPMSSIDATLRLTDAEGKSGVVDLAAFTTALRHPPGETYEPPSGVPDLVGSNDGKVALNMIRVPLAAFPGLDPEQVVNAALELESPSGELYVSDMWVQAEDRDAFAS